MENRFLRVAIAEAEKASKKNKVPVGAVIELNGKIVSRTHNLIESTFDSTAHAEILAIRKAGKKLKNWRLTGATLYVTMEPCRICKSAIIQSRISKVVFGCSSNGEMTYPARVKYVGPLMQDVCSRMMRKFFKRARQR